MKEYVDEKFWKMLSGFVTLIIVSVIFLVVIKIYKNSEASSINGEDQAITSNQ